MLANQQVGNILYVGSDGQLEAINISRRSRNEVLWRRVFGSSGIVTIATAMQKRRLAIHQYGNVLFAPPDPEGTPVTVGRLYVGFKTSVHSLDPVTGATIWRYKFRNLRAVRSGYEGISILPVLHTAAAASTSASAAATSPSVARSPTTSTPTPAATAATTPFGISSSSSNGCGDGNGDACGGGGGGMVGNDDGMCDRIIAGWDGQISCLDAETGRQVWNTTLHSGILDANKRAYVQLCLVGERNEYIAATSMGTVTLLDVELGKDKWSYGHLKGRGYHVAADSDYIYVTQKRAVLQFHPEHGNYMGSLSLPYASKKPISITATPGVKGVRLANRRFAAYVTSVISKPVWVFTPDKSKAKSTIVPILELPHLGQTLYFKDQFVVALDTLTGAALWRLELPYRPGKKLEPAVLYDSVSQKLFVKFGLSLFAIDPAARAVVFEIPLPPEFTGTSCLGSSFSNVNINSDTLISHYNDMI